MLSERPGSAYVASGYEISALVSLTFCSKLRLCVLYLCDYICSKRHIVAVQDICAYTHQISVQH